jgi:hypothetical protein
VSARTGNAWKSQEYLFEYFAWSGAQYPSRILARIFGEDNIAKFNLKQGEEVTVWLRFDANKSQAGTRWFNEIRINNVERPQSNQSTQLPAQPQIAAAEPANAPQPNNYPPGFERPATSPENGKDDDLPF